MLIVDDQPRSRKSLRAFLSTWPGVGEIHETSSGREAVQLVKELQPDVVLMDVRLSETDGLKAIVQIKALRPEVKVIVVSMYTTYQDEALAIGADAFVAKSDAPDSLLGILAAILHQAQSARLGI